jgi:hypothetical protein
VLVCGQDAWRKFTSGFFIDALSLCLVNVKHEYSKISPTSKVTTFEHLPRCLIEHVDRYVVLVRLYIARPKSPSFLVRLIRLPCCNKWEDRVQGLRRRRWWWHVSNSLCFVQSLDSIVIPSAMPPTPKASRPSVARTLHQRVASQTPTTPIKSSPLARSSTPPKATATPRPPSRPATPGSRNSIVIGDSPGKALPLNDTAPDLNEYVRPNRPFVDLKNVISHLRSFLCYQIEKRFAQIEATFERGADHLLQKSQYEHPRLHLLSAYIISDRRLKWNK